jgi:hypothetical protein
MKKFTLLLIIILGVIFNSYAQEERKFVSGNSISYAIPQGTAGDIYDFGYGFYANIDYNFSKHFIGRFDLGWNQFDGDDLYGIEVEKQNVWEFSGGLRARVSLFYAEIMGGYFTGFDSWGYKPAVGLRWKKLDLQANYNFIGDVEWIGLRLGYYWGN